MFNIGPAVHGDGAQLDLQPYGFLGISQKAQRHRKDHVIASIAVGLRVADIVLFRLDLHAGDGADQLRRAVDILNERTDQTDARSVKDVFHRAFRRDGKSEPLQLLPHTLRAFDARLRRRDRVAVSQLYLVAADHIHAGEKLGDRAFQQDQVLSVEFPLCRRYFRY